MHKAINAIRARNVPSGIVLMILLVPALAPALDPVPMNICEFSRDYAKYAYRFIAVRGVYYYGLRDESCTEKCSDGSWPSFIDLTGGDDAGSAALVKAERAVELDAKKGKRFEIWVTAVGRLRTNARPSPHDPCNRGINGYWGYGHLGVFPAQLVVERLVDIVVKENPKSPYDYGNMYHGPL